LNYLSNSALPDGTVTAPSISFASDPDTGIIKADNNLLGIVAGGISSVNLTS
jgi:hypothetical protein